MYDWCYKETRMCHYRGWCWRCVVTRRWVSRDPNIPNRVYYITSLGVNRERTLKSCSWLQWIRKDASHRYTFPITFAIFWYFECLIAWESNRIHQKLMKLIRHKLDWFKHGHGSLKDRMSYYPQFSSLNDLPHPSWLGVHMYQTAVSREPELH